MQGASIYYFDIVLVACTCDAKIHIFHVMYSVVEIKNKNNMSWFLVQVQDAIIDMEHEIVLIFYRQKILQKPYRMCYQMCITFIAYLI